MHRKLFTLAAGVSAVVCIAVAGLCVRGYFVTDQFYTQGFWDAGDRSYWGQERILTGRGGISLARVVQSGSRPSYGMQMGRRFGSHPFHITRPPEYPESDLAASNRSTW